MGAFSGVSQMRAVFGTALLAFALGGCQTEAYCFLCSDTNTRPDGGGGAPSTGGAGGSIILPDSGQAGGTSDGGEEAATCQADILNDVQNCGACGNRCDLPGAFAKCQNGQCVVASCGDGLVDLDKNPANGCECSLSNNGVEICDQLDNNCDGQVDEGFNTNSDVNNCGACNNACAPLPHSGVLCVDGACSYECEQGYSSLNQSGIGCPYQCPVFPTKTETCDGKDQDCDGVIDNGSPGAGIVCETNCPGGHCKGDCTPGLTVCTGTSAGVICVGGTGPTGEICDGHDNNCDGRIDEGFNFLTDVLNCGGCGIQCNAGDPCTNGKCQFTCPPGRLDLDGLPGNQCEYACPVFPGVPEVCNGIDDDCDGVADDSPGDVGGSCAADCPTVDPCVKAGNCSPYAISGKDASGKCYGVCSSGGKLACVAGVKTCQHPTFAIEEACDSLDNNCDGRIDEGFNLQTDPLNCGACGTVCKQPNTLAMTCTAGKCTAISACQPGYIDKNGTLSDGCEYKCPVFPPVGESCNGIDDDCDGTADNNVSGVGQSCTLNCPAPAPCIAAGNCTNAVSAQTNGCYGVCALDGRTSCTAGKVACTHPAQDAETCNGVDDDCDGLIDDGFNLQTDPKNCGACGFVCALPGASTQTCVAGVCNATGCAAGFKDLDGNPANGCEYACPVFPVATETCNGKDDDCDGVKDDSPTGLGTSCATNCPAPDPCVAANTCSYPLGPKTGSCYGVCQTDGKTACGSGAITCQHSGQTSETCNGLDDDCDGMVDDGFNLQTDPLNCGTCGHVCAASNATAVSCVNGTCSAITACAPGYQNNDGSLANGCEYKCPVYPPVGESCNGIDDDCDGNIDDSIVGLGQACTLQCPAPAACVATNSCAYTISSQTNGCYGVCATDGRTACSAGKTTCSHPAARTETCNNLDDDCDGQVDNGFNLLTDAKNCGGCGNICALANTTSSSCSGGSCQVGTCTGGYANVDGNQANGCEYKCPVYPIKTETCNGIDDDCDGKIDDNPSGVDVACSDNCPGGVCKGICTTGLKKCVSGTLVCQGGGGAQLEVCNNKDDDCDGTVDNGFNTATDPVNCGSCGNVCNLPNVSANKCTNGVCGVGTCANGYADLTSSAGCEYQCPVFPTTTEVCNGKDDDCDGLVDKNDPGMSTPSNFCLQTGPCSGSVPQCKGASGWGCNYPASVELNANGTVKTVETLCDNFDNNCNGQVDETFPLKGQACTVGVGICARSTAYTCKSDKTAVECLATAVPTDAKDEECNGKDDNCDGNIDERTPVAGTQCYNTSQHACLGWKDAMVAIGGGVYMYSYEASRPDADASNAGIGASRACSIQNRLPWTSANQADAAAACAAIKDSAGNPMRLCTATEWQTACLNGSTTDPTWSYATNPTVYSAGTCNDVNSTAGGPWPTGMNGLGAQNQCYVPRAAGNIFDLSGNVSEWTSTLVTVGTQNYYRVRGGNYQTLPLGTRCNFNFVLEQPTFANFDLGFRCCSNAAP